MYSSSSVTTSLYFSLFIQFITGLIGLYTVYLPLDKEYYILKEILALETAVQFIEGLFYIWFALNLSKYKDITKFRYYDWVITTPTMLLSTIALFEYEKYKKERQNTTHLTLHNFIYSNKNTITTIFFSNFFMLLFGYLQEIGILDIFSSSILGFIAFGYLFYTIYDKYVVNNSVESYYLYLFNLIVWGTYGIAAMLDNAPKNTLYNILDIISKNFYGLYLVYKIYAIKSS